MTEQQTHYELQDEHGRNVGECMEGDLKQTIARARWTQNQLQPSGKVGRLRVMRVRERLVPERVETELAVLDHGRLVSTRRNVADGLELRALVDAPLELETAA